LTNKQKKNTLEVYSLQKAEVEMSRAQNQEPISLRELLEHMVKALVDLPGEVKVTEVAGQHSTIFEVCMHKSDIGKVIGKKGAHAIAIRRIISAAGGKLKQRCVVEIIEPNE
jgi:uncharacterized protein